MIFGWHQPAYMVDIARCRSLYMEIVQKLVAVALVSVVGSEDSLELSFAITMAMAATSAMVKPFLQPQARRVGGQTGDMSCS